LIIVLILSILGMTLHINFVQGLFFAFFSAACECTTEVGECKNLDDFVPAYFERTEKLEVVNVHKPAEHVLEKIGGKQCIQMKMR
jgi:hypothetical protein